LPRSYWRSAPDAAASSSSVARAPSHRRVVHLEFAPPDILPDGLSWNSA
jgi:hypothetical protein